MQLDFSARHAREAEFEERRRNPRKQAAEFAKVKEFLDGLGNRQGSA